MANGGGKTGSKITRRQFLRLSAGAASAAVVGRGFSSYAHSGEYDYSSTASQARVIKHVQTNARKVCLSFDDMWSEYYTWRIGRDFHRLNIPLTIFPIGLAVHNNNARPHEGYEELYVRLRDMGHEFGCHLYTHRDIRDFSLQQLIDEELEPSLNAMRRALGHNFKPIGIRPPYGVLTDALKELSVQYGIPLVLWGLDSQDSVCAYNCRRECPETSVSTDEVYMSLWSGDPADAACARSTCAERCVGTILRNYESYMRPGTIILHHGLKSSHLAIGQIAAFLRDWNLKPVRLTELLRHG